MKKILIIGAYGSIARLVTTFLDRETDLHLTLFLRKASRLQNDVSATWTVLEGNALDFDSVKFAVRGQDIVYINLVGDLEAMTKNVVRAMIEEKVNRVIFISSIGIYEIPLRSELQPYRKGADVIEGSELDYTILRPEWFSNSGDTFYETTVKGTPEKGGTVSRLGLATLIADIIRSPRMHSRSNLSVSS